MQAVERDNDSVKIVRPVVASTYFSVGNNQVYDTYLSINIAVLMWASGTKE